MTNTLPAIIIFPLLAFREAVPIQYALVVSGGKPSEGGKKKGGFRVTVWDFGNVCGR